MKNRGSLFGSSSYGSFRLPPVPRAAPASLVQAPGIQVALGGAALKPDERGLIMGPPLVVHEGKGAITFSSDDYNPSEFRCACLYWDRIEWLQTVFLGYQPPEVDYLRDAGVAQLSRTQPIGGARGGEFLARSQETIFSLLEQRDPGAWAITSGSLSTKVMDQLTEPDRGLLVRLHNVLPVPAGDVPLAEVLEFKGRRASELLHLRATLERLYQEIEAAPDKPLAERTEMQELDRSASDAIRVARETKFPFQFSDWNVKVSLQKAGLGAAAGAMLGSAALPGLSSIVGGIIGGVWAGLDIEPKVGLRDRRTVGPFEYLVQYDKEFGRS